jgi:DNA-binding response OmpR family regulator
MKLLAPMKLMVFPVRNFLPLFGMKAKPSAPAPAAEPAPAPAPPNAHRILVVDDDPVVRKATELKLRAHRYAVCTADDGPSAIRAVRTECPDLVVLDLGFPPEVSVSWDGFGILNWLRRLECSKDLPIIIVTGSQDSKLEQRARTAGASGFFHKPLNYDALLALIEHRLKMPKPANTAPGNSSFEI